jgi:peptide/nickel transport system permease protein
MLKSYFFQRFLHMLICLFVVTTIVFFLFRLVPGNPIGAMVDPSFDAKAIGALEKRFGLDKPIHEQYFLYLKNILHGDFGISFFYRQPSFEILFEKIFNTIILALVAIVSAYILGTITGVWLAWRRGSVSEAVVILVSLFLSSAPLFWLGMLAIMFFSYWLGWFPNAGMHTPGFEPGWFLGKYFSLDFLYHLFLPAFVYSLHNLAKPMLLMRNNIAEFMHEDFIEIARAKGVSEAGIMYRHAARNALLPVVTSFSVSMGLAIGGQVLIEYVFGWPGLGREIVLAAKRYDYPLAQASFILLACAVMIMNFVADIIYGFLDPRISYK